MQHLRFVESPKVQSKIVRLTADDNYDFVIYLSWDVFGVIVADLQSVNIFLSIIYVQQPQRCWERRCVLGLEAIAQ